MFRVLRWPFAVLRAPRGRQRLRRSQAASRGVAEVREVLFRLPSVATGSSEAPKAPSRVAVRERSERTERRRGKGKAPKGPRPTTERNLDVSWVERDSVRLQHRFELFPETPSPMMLGLAVDIRDDPFGRRRADRECGIPILPVETPLTNLPVNPLRRNRLDLAEDISDAMGRIQARKEMDVVVDSAYAQRHATKRINTAAEESMQVRNPRLLNHRGAVLGGKDDVIPQAGVAHESGAMQRALRAALKGESADQNGVATVEARFVM